MLRRHGILCLAYLLIGWAGCAECAEPQGAADLPAGAVARLGNAGLGHNIVINHLAFSPDGKTLYSGRDSIRAWNADTGRLLAEIGSWSDGMAMAVSPDGRVVAHDINGAVILFDAATGQRLQALKGHAYFTEAIAFSPDGKTVATSGRDRFIRLRNSADGKELRTLDTPGTTTYLAFAADGNAFVSLNWNERGTIFDCRLWDLTTGDVLHMWKDVLKPVVVSADGTTLALGTKPNRMQLWDLAARAELRTVEIAPPRRSLHGLLSTNEAAKGAAISSDGRRLAVADSSNCVHVVDTVTGRELYRSEPLDHEVRCAAFSPDGKTLAVGDWQRIVLWDAATGREQLAAQGHNDRVDRVVFSPAGATAVTAADDAVVFWDIATGREKQRLSNGRKFQDFVADGTVLLEFQGAVEHYDPSSGKTLRTFRLRPNESLTGYQSIAAIGSPDGKTMFTGSNDRTVRQWDLDDGRELWKHERPWMGKKFPDGNGHQPLGFTADGQGVVSVGYDHLARILDRSTGRELRRIPIAAATAELSPDGRLLVALRTTDASPGRLSDRSTPPRIWDLSQPDATEPKTPYAWPTNAFAFSPDGVTAAASSHSTIVVFNLADGAELMRFKGHEGQINDLEFSSDGRLLISGGYDRTAIVWKLK